MFTIIIKKSHYSKGGMDHAKHCPDQKCNCWLTYCMASVGGVQPAESLK